MASPESIFLQTARSVPLQKLAEQSATDYFWVPHSLQLGLDQGSLKCLGTISYLFPSLLVLAFCFNHVTEFLD